MQGFEEHTKGLRARSRMDVASEGSKTTLAKTALAQITELKAIVSEMRNRKEYPAHIAEVEAQGIAAIKADLLANSKLEQERINTRLSTLEKEYHKKARENPVDTNAILARYSAMSDKELLSESMNMIANPKGNNPLIADFLSAECRNRELETHSILREKLIANDYLKPWLASPEGSALSKESKFYDHSRPSDFLIEATNQAGNPELVAVNIQDIYYGD